MTDWDRLSDRFSLWPCPGLHTPRTLNGGNAAAMPLAGVISLSTPPHPHDQMRSCSGRRFHGADEAPRGRRYMLRSATPTPPRTERATNPCYVWPVIVWSLVCDSNLKAAKPTEYCSLSQRPEPKPRSKTRVACRASRLPVMPGMISREYGFLSAPLF